MDAALINAIILFGALVGFIGGLVNLMLWKRTLKHKHVLGIKVHEGFEHAINEVLENASTELTPDMVKLETKILDLFDNFMATGLTQKMPVLSMFIDDKLIDEIRVIFHAEMSANLPQLLKSGLAVNENKSEIITIAAKAMDKVFKQYSKHAIIYLLIGTAVGALLGLGFACMLDGLNFHA